MMYPDDLPLGTRRRVAVACQLINASPLLILHDVLDGIQEGDALAIMRCLQDFCRYISPHAFILPWQVFKSCWHAPTCAHLRLVQKSNAVQRK